MAGNVPSWQNLGLRFSNGSLHENLRAARQISCAASLHVLELSLQPMFPPKPLDTLPLEVDAQKV